MFFTAHDERNSRQFKLKKSLGQNFLKNQSVVQRIVNLIDDKDIECVEIGPGSGMMTQLLLNEGHKVHAFEIDRRLEDPLKKRFKEYSSFHLYMGDYLKTEVPAELSQRAVAVVSNLPYNNGTAIIKKVLRDFSAIRICVFMLQKEVALRMVSDPGNKSYGSLSVFMQYHFDIWLAFTISPKHFSPPPKVDSTVIRLIPKSEKPLGENPEEFFEFVRQGFKMRRKKLKNNYDFDVMSYASRIGLDDTIRAEEISLEQWIKLFQEVKRDG
ncbi:MAG: 16S rRNA (adenine(1518)-N(6)/adenine(1519)-N(6))-dimethyltransferase RsmA [Thermotogota bacterium]|nr:16S rRNA (adenine(1518)-N(6)/adenine(1519)-N(6))-dimethyltransferase RsmA [Thermotogota bacterium]